MPPDPPRGFPEGFAREPEDRRALLELSRLPSLVPRDLRSLAWREGSAATCLRAVGRGALGAASARAAAEQRAPEVRDALRRCGARLVAPGDPGYPSRLEDLPDPPAWLFVRGEIPEARAAAIVGARRCTPYGRESAEAIGEGLASAGVCVVSGAALGVDAAGHRGAMRGGGPTVAVLGSGIDVEHPRSNRRLIEEIAARWCVVSEYPPGTPPEPRRFPARNRIVAGLCEIAVVVEGAAGSGSLITAEFCLDLGRPVVAVPGPVTSPLSDAPHALIRDGAELVRGAGDVLASMGVLQEAHPLGSALSLSDVERRALDAVCGTPVTAESAAAASGLPAGELLAALGSLELRGLVRSVGGRYERTSSAAGSV